MVKITSFTAHQTAEGQRLSFNYSTIDDEGRLVRSNERQTVIVLDDEILDKIADITEWLYNKLPQ